MTEARPAIISPLSSENHCHTLRLLLVFPSHEPITNQGDHMKRKQDYCRLNRRHSLDLLEGIEPRIRSGFIGRTVKKGPSSFLERAARAAVETLEPRQMLTTFTVVPGSDGGTSELRSAITQAC